jgi:hypothetical protein
MATTRLTAAQTILQAAGSLPATFSDAELVVASWEADKERFGLRGFEQRYPHSNKVIAEICGKKPCSPIVLGYLARIAPNTFRLTDVGRAEIARLNGQIPADDHAALRRVLDHPDFLRWRETQERPTTHTIKHAEALAVIFRRHAGKHVVGRPGTPGWRTPVTPQMVGEALAFLEVAMNRARSRKRSARLG